MKYFGLIKELIMAVKLKKNEEHFFELNDVEVIFDVLEIEMKSLKRDFFELFINFIIVGLFLWRKIIN